MEFSSDPLSTPEPAGQAAGPVASDQVAFLLYLRGRTQEQLEEMLRLVQHRLGTAQEREHDLAAAQHIAHQLNNLRTCADLAAEIERLGRPKA